MSMFWLWYGSTVLRGVAVGGNWIKCTRDICVISYNYMWIYNYLISLVVKYLFWYVLVIFIHCCSADSCDLSVFMSGDELGVFLLYIFSQLPKISLYWGQKQSSTITNLILPKAGYLKDQGSDCAGLQLRLMAYQLCGLAPFLSGVILSSFLTFPMAVIALPMPT